MSSHHGGNSTSNAPFRSGQLRSSSSTITGIHRSSIVHSFLREDLEEVSCTGSDFQFNSAVRINRYDDIVRSYSREQQTLEPDDDDAAKEEEEERSVISEATTSGSRWEDFETRARGVDQTINLMDVEANQYDYSYDYASSRRSILQEDGSSRNPIKRRKSKSAQSRKAEQVAQTRALLSTIMAVTLTVVVFSLTLQNNASGLLPDGKGMSNGEENTDSPTTVPTVAPTPLSTPKPELYTHSPTQITLPPHASTAAISPSSAESALATLIVHHSSEVDMDAPHSKKAIEWLTKYDKHPHGQDPEEANLQRYCLAALFFAAHPAVDAEAAQSSSLAIAESNEKDESDGNEDEDNQRQLVLTSPPSSKVAWMTPGVNICQWNGVECDLDLDINLDDEGVSLDPASRYPLLLLDLSKSNMTGPIPAVEFELLLQYEPSLLQINLSHNELTSLPDIDMAIAENDDNQLQYLFLHNNSFTGTIPPSLLAFQGLYHVDMSSNQFTGQLQFPIELPHLRKLYAQDNALTGSLPPELFAHSNLLHLRLDNNLLEGSLVTDIARLSHLTILALSKNRFSGELPDVWPNQLQQIDLHENVFSGSMPDSIWMIPGMEELLLGDNKLSGTISSRVEGLTSLRSLELKNNSLTGSIPSEIGHLAYLEDLWLQNNKLSGSIPMELGQVLRLEQAFLNDNQLEGEVDDWLSSDKLHRLASLQLQHNQLTGVFSPETCRMKHLYNLGYLSADCYEAECACCDKCYRR